VAQPTPYSRQYNFTNFQTVSPTTPLPANQVDLELNTIKATLDQTLNNLKLIQRDDTALASNSVGKDQLKAEVSIGINPPNPWVTAHNYVVGDTTVVSGKFYRCVVSHLSTVFATDLAALDWTLIIDFNTVGFDFAGTIHLATAKTIPNDADEFGSADSSALYGLKKTTWANFKATMFSAWGALIATGVAKAAPVDADAFAFMDSAAANATKMLTWANLKATHFTAWGALTAAGTAKATPVGADMVVIADSAAGNATKMATLTSWFAAMFTALGPLIAAATGKSTPVDTDGLLISDSAASGAGKLVTWTQAWANYFKAKADALYLPLAGGTLTGNLNIAKYNPYLILKKTAASGQANTVIGNLNELNRWFIRPGNDVSESGSNLGSNLDVLRFDDSGAFLEAAFQVARSDGTFSIARLLNLASATAGQIQFPSTWNASANANTLDGYAEGTWTPNLTFGGASVGITYTSRICGYITIGAFVFVFGQFTLSSKGSSVGGALIGGLPFTSGPTYRTTGSVGYTTMTTIPLLGSALSGTVINLYKAAGGVISDTDFTNTTELDFSFLYSRV
jgi:hypothetical protein